MDEELLRGKGLEPERGEIAAVDGFALRIGQRAALDPTPGAKVYGLVFSLTRSELDRLYSEPSVQAYKPQDVLAQLASGSVVAALLPPSVSSGVITPFCQEKARQMRPSPVADVQSDYPGLAPILRAVLS